MSQPLVRILGMDASGKTSVCRTLERLDSQLIAFEGTPKYAYRWLATYGVGKADEVTPEQINIRQHVFTKMNEHEAFTHRSIIQERPVVAVRGRADTLISANALRRKPMPRDFNILFPKPLRPDLLVVLTAPLWTVEERLNERGEKKSGANSMEYHYYTKPMYEDLATIARRHMPILTYDTSHPSATPERIAREILETMNGLRSVPRKVIARAVPFERLTLDELDMSVNADIALARNMALNKAYPHDKRTKAGCVLRSGPHVFTGATIKRRTGDGTTCCERMALDQAFVHNAKSLDRLVLFVHRADQLNSFVAPCGTCRELLKEAVFQLGQIDVPIYLASPVKHTVIKTSLSALLPFSDGLLNSELWTIDD